MSADTLMFYAIFGAVLGTAVLVVTVRNLVHACVWLVLCFLGVACLFLVLENELLFAVQLMIYAGAIPILVLFVLMLTREVMSEARREHGRLWPLGLISALTLLSVALPIFARIESPPSFAPVPSDLTQRIGIGFLGDYVLPFEVASLLLLGALVGAVYLAKKSGHTPGVTTSPTSTEDKESGNGRDTTESLADRVGPAF